jgi:YegS/Rv2252/BmrU family lipid kinase
MSEWYFIINPNAGNGSGSKNWEDFYVLLKSEDIKFNFEFTKFKNDAKHICVNAIKTGYRKICILGGDGTMNEVVNGIMLNKTVPSTDILFSMLPIGTGNDWSRTFGITKDLKTNLELLKSEKNVIQDIGKATYYIENERHQRYFANIAGIGFDALVALKTNSDKDNKKSGAVLYLINLLSSLISYKSIKCKINFNDINVNTKLFSLSVGKGNYNGGGMKQLPRAIFDDGYLDFTLINDITILEVIANIHKLYNGTHVSHPKIDTFKTKTLKVESEKTIFLELDGESVGNSPFEFEVVPKALKVLSSI